jgi:hypothetical protein
MDNTNRTVTWLGTTDEVTTCDCCGKKDLKGTVALSINDSDAVYYGCTCAARALGRTVKEVRVESKKVDDLARKVRELRSMRKTSRFCEIRDLFFDRAAGVIRDWAGQPDTFAQLDRLGGPTAGWAAFNSFLSANGAEGVL